MGQRMAVYQDKTFSNRSKTPKCQSKNNFKGDITSSYSVKSFKNYLGKWSKIGDFVREAVIKVYVNTLYCYLMDQI